MTSRSYALTIATFWESEGGSKDKYFLGAIFCVWNDAFTQTV